MADLRTSAGVAVVPSKGLVISTYFADDPVVATAVQPHNADARVLLAVLVDLGTVP